MKSWNDFILQALLLSHQVLACADHEDVVRDMLHDILYSDNDLSDETITCLDEVVHCDACRLMAAIVTGDLGWLETQPDLASAGSGDGDLHAAATESLGEPHSIGGCAVVEAQQTPMDDDSRPQVHELRLINSGRARNVNQPKLPFVKPLSVVHTYHSEMLIRNTPTRVNCKSIVAPEVNDPTLRSGDTTRLAGFSRPPGRGPMA